MDTLISAASVVAAGPPDECAHHVFAMWHQYPQHDVSEQSACRSGARERVEE